MKRLKIILQSRKFLIISVLALIFYVIFFTKIIKYNSIYENGLVSVTGQVKGYKIDGDKLNFIINSKEKIQVSYYFKDETEKEILENKVKLGIIVKINGELKEPSNNTVPNTFNYKKYLYNKKIYKLLVADKVEIVSDKTSILYKIKNFFIKRTNNFSETSGYMQAFILGDKNYIDSDVYETFRTNGVTHLFAVSGMHISLLVFSLMGLLKKLKLKDNYVQLIIICFLFFYMFLIGFTASVVRASLLYILMIINKKININLNGLAVIYLLFMFLLIINPFYIYDLGFIYSFLTSFGLILFNNKIKGSYIKKLFLVSLIATLFSLPVTLYNFYEFNLLTILNNIIIVPLVSLILFPLALMTFIIPILNSILGIGFEALEFISVFISKFNLNIVVPKVNVLFIIIYYGFLFLIYKYGFKNSFLIILLVFFYKLLPYFDNNAYIYFLDVGQGDATLFITEHRKEIVLIDSGGLIEYEKEKWQIRNSSFSLADNLVSFFHSLGIDKIDVLIITHGDIDHLGYAKDIASKIKINKLMLNNNVLNNREKELQNLIKKRIYNKYVDSKIKISNLNELVEKDENNSSLVLYTELSNMSLLLMGDAPIKVEKDILNKYKINAAILKVGHHGSNTSSSKEFIDRINPKYSVVSVGKNNRYGHPNEEVLENLRDSKIYRTDIDGSIKFAIKKDKLDISTCPP